MEKNNRRITAEEFFAEAKGYFDKLGLTASMDSFMSTEPVKTTIHETYMKYEECVNEVVQGLPKAIKKRGEELLVKATGQEDAFSHDVKANLICNITRLIKALEEFVPVDETISNVFYKAFTEEADGKMLEMVKYFANGLAGSLLEDFKNAVSIPDDLPPEVAAFVSMLTGCGGVAMNFEEFMEFMDFMDDMTGDCDEQEDDDEQDGCDGNDECSCGGECGSKCKCKNHDTCEEDGCHYEDGNNCC